MISTTNNPPWASLARRILRKSLFFMKNLGIWLPFMSRRQGADKPPVDRGEFATVRRKEFASRVKADYCAAQATMMREAMFVHRGGFR